MNTKGTMKRIKAARMGMAVGAAGAIVLGTIVFMGAAAAPVDDLAIPVRTAPAIRGSMVADLASAPFVPAPIDRDYATKVIVNIEVIEKEMEIADGTTTSSGRSAVPSRATSSGSVKATGSS